MLGTLRRSGWCWKSHEVSKEFQSKFEVFIRASTSLFILFTGKSNGIESTNLIIIFNVGAKKLKYCFATTELQYATTALRFISFDYKLNPAISERYPEGFNLNAGVPVVILDHVINSLNLNLSKFSTFIVRKPLFFLIGILYIFCIEHYFRIKNFSPKMQKFVIIIFLNTNRCRNNIFK